MLCAEPRSASTHKKPYITFEGKFTTLFKRVRKCLIKSRRRIWKKVTFLLMVNILSIIPHSSKTIIFTDVFAFDLCKSSIHSDRWLNFHDRFLLISYITQFAKSRGKHVFSEFSPKSRFLFFGMQKKNC